MTLPLIDPIGGDFLKAWPGQNEHNLDLIDAKCGPPGVLTYIPVLTAAVTNPNLGTTGEIKGFYYLVLDFVFSWGYFKFGGSSINSGDSTYIVTLPFAADPIYIENSDAGNGFQLGNGIIYDDSSGTNRQPCVVQLRDSTHIFFNQYMEGTSSTRSVSGSSGGIPIVWATGDYLTWQVRYKREI
jgi:hypothetical protein